MKVTIIGGGGRVGSNTAFALQMGRVASEIVLIDANQSAAEGEALDLMHGSPLVADQIFRAGTYADVGTSCCVIITAGLRRQPNESRLDLINRNVVLFKQILSDIKSVGLRRDTLVVVVSNPVDVLTYLAVQSLDIPATQVLGLGTQLDTTRFRSLIAEKLHVPATQVAGVILGEHGDSMVPIWSSCSVACLPIERFPHVTAQWQNDIFKRTQGSGAEAIKLKGGAGYAVALSIREMVEAMLLDQRRILPVSTLQRGCYGIHDVALSVPTRIGRQGMIEHLEIELWPKEVAGLQKSASVLKDTIKAVEKV